MKKKKEITIEDLAVMVNNGFESARKQMDKRFDGVDKRFDKVENRLDKVENRLGEVESRLDDVESKVSQIDRRLYSIEEDVADIKVKQYKDLSVRVTFIEKKLGIANTK